MFNAFVAMGGKYPAKFVEAGPVSSLTGTGARCGIPETAIRFGMPWWHSMRALTEEDDGETDIRSRRRLVDELLATSGLMRG
jgi:hypothetical protein